MKYPRINTKVVHSLSKPAWNVVADKQWGAKFKIARCPYVVTGDKIGDNMRRQEAYEHAEYISFCFNNSGKIKDIQI